MSCYLAVGSQNNSEVKKSHSRCLYSRMIRGGQPLGQMALCVILHSAGQCAVFMGLTSHMASCVRQLLCSCCKAPSQVVLLVEMSLTKCRVLFRVFAVLTVANPFIHYVSAPSVSILFIYLFFCILKNTVTQMGWQRTLLVKTDNYINFTSAGRKTSSLTSLRLFKAVITALGSTLLLLS